MTTPVNPVPIPDPLQPLPDPSDLNSWAVRMAEMHRWMREDAAPGMNGLGDACFTNAQVAQELSLIAVAAANFKGNWASLTGALAVPAAVWHAGRVWCLLSNLLDVTSSEPGVSADWVDISGVRRSGDTMTGPLEVPAGASGAQVPQAQEIPSLLGITGQVAFFARSTAPAGWLKANGATVSRTTYAELFAAIGTTFGAGDGATTFKLPDMRGEFPRGWDDGRGVDAGRAFGSAQTDALKSHTHTYQVPSAAGVNGPSGTYGGYTKIDPGTTGSTGGTETRPRNIALLACIKY